MKRTLDLLDRIGLPWELAPNWVGPVWNGERFTFDPGDSYGEIGQFHELMHWVVADDIQRKQPDFGLGMNVGSIPGWRSSTWRDSPKDFDGERSWSDEIRVSRADSAIKESYAVWGMGL